MACRRRRRHHSFPAARASTRTHQPSSPRPPWPATAARELGAGQSAGCRRRSRPVRFDLRVAGVDGRDREPVAQLNIAGASARPAAWAGRLVPVLAGVAGRADEADEKNLRAVSSEAMVD
jgi:hypothetical protein